jgi:hypothetical protein
VSSQERGLQTARRAETLRRLEDRGLVATEAMRVRLHPDFSAIAELVAFTRDFLTAMPDYRLGTNQKVEAR